MTLREFFAALVEILAFRPIPPIPHLQQKPRFRVKAGSERRNPFDGERLWK